MNIHFAEYVDESRGIVKLHTLALVADHATGLIFGACCGPHRDLATHQATAVARAIDLIHEHGIDRPDGKFTVIHNGSERVNTALKQVEGVRTEPVSFRKFGNYNTQVFGNRIGRIKIKARSETSEYRLNAETAKIPILSGSDADILLQVEVKRQNAPIVKALKSAQGEDFQLTNHGIMREALMAVQRLQAQQSVNATP